MSTVAFTLSKAAMRLVQSGQAALSSGGVRLLDGTLFELAKPALTSSTGKLLASPVAGAINIASSLSTNIQCAVIQSGINQANLKLNNVIQQLGHISTAMNSLNAIHALSWVNSIFGLANLGISIVGFHQTLKKLDLLNRQVNQFHSRYRSDRDSDLIDEYEIIVGNLNNDLQFLKEYQTGSVYNDENFKNNVLAMNTHINEAIKFLRKVCRRLSQRTVDGRLGTEIIFTLSQIIAQAINEFCCTYYYVFHSFHRLYSDCMDTLGEINSPTFEKEIQRYFAFEPCYAAITPMAKKNAVLLAMQGIEQQQNRLQTCHNLVLTIPYEDYKHLDDNLNKKVYEAVILQLPQFSGKTIGDVDQLLTEVIQRQNLEGLREDSYLLAV